MTEKTQQICPICNSNNTRRDSKRKTTIGAKQRWYCKDCKKRFTENALPNIKGNDDTVILAIDLYLKGVSYRGIQDSIRQFYGLDTSTKSRHQTKTRMERPPTQSSTKNTINYFSKQYLKRKFHNLPPK